MIPTSFKVKCNALRRCKKCGSMPVVRLTAVEKYTLAMDGDELTVIDQNDSYLPNSKIEIRCPTENCGSSSIFNYTWGSLDAASEDWNNRNGIPERKTVTLLEEMQRLDSIRGYGQPRFILNIIMDRDNSATVSGTLTEMRDILKVFTKDILSVHHWNTKTDDDKSHLVACPYANIDVYWFPGVPEID